MPSYQSTTETRPFSHEETSTTPDFMSNEERPTSGGNVSSGERSVSAEEASSLFGNFAE